MPAAALDPALLESQGREFLALLTRYWETIEQRPVRSQVKPGEVLARLPEHAPEQGCASAHDWDALRHDVESIVLPGLTHWQHPGFFAYFPSNISTPAVLGELLSAGLGVQGMLWSTSPACTELEMRTLDWLGEAIGLPDSFLFRGNGGGVIQGTASEATLAALVAARGRASRDVPEDAPMPELVVYASHQAHSSITKACMIAGIARHAEDRRHIRFIDTDTEYRQDPAKLEAALRADYRAGRRPAFVVASVGTTSSTAIDSIEAISEAITRATPAGAARAWLHVDAAHAGAACIAPEFRWMLRGIEGADSICFNPHKWLLTNFDCDCFWTRFPRELIDSMNVTPEYLRNQASDSGSVVDYRDWHVALGRRFRALKLWFVMRHFGLAGLRAHVREHVRLAEVFETWMARDDRFEICTPRRLNLVCFRLRARPGESPDATDACNRTLLNAINQTGCVFLTHTVLPAIGDMPPRFTLRLAVGAATTRERHVRQAWELIANLASS